MLSLLPSTAATGPVPNLTWNTRMPDALSYSAAHFASYNKTHGSLGAMIGLMLWLRVSVVVIRLGAEPDAATEKVSDDVGTEVA
jgi:hypothetical protein